ncbi:SRPBCC family protein [Actinosynnema sp. NPDC020468]|uniref:SRPBCC family protein n=1 Tax=Actinosynnema sp. NPDC020468 TaxID=3154488 RepID=UPI0033F977E3
MTRTFTVRAEPEAVAGYLRDFARTEEWDPGTVSTTRLGDDPVGVGTRWHNVSKFLGSTTELTYELTREEPGRLVFVGRNDTATSTDDISLVAGGTPGTTEITYRAHVEFNGLAKLAAPVAKVAFEKLGNEVERNLTRVLDGKRTDPGA